MSHNEDPVDKTQPIKKHSISSFKKVEVGDVIAGQYKILRHLDEGGMGMIFEAEEQIAQTVRRVALKVMHAPEDPEGQIRFQREASVAVSLEHLHTVNVLGFGTTKTGAFYLVMELLKGHSFKKEVKKGPVEPLRLLQVMRQICGALGEAHSKRIIHRDIKPSNIFITNHEHVFAKLLDFGLVKSLDGAQDVSQTGLVLGSPMYMSPEQVDAQSIDQRCDIYSLGMTMYHAACGHAPYKGTVSKILMSQLLKMPPSFSDVLSEHHIHPLLEWIIFTCIQKDPNDRFQDTTQLKKALELCEESIYTGRSIALHLEKGELRFKDGGVVNLHEINKTSMYVREVPTKPEAEPRNGKVIWSIILLLVIAIVVVGVVIFSQLPVKDPVVKTIIQTQTVPVTAPEPMKTEVLIDSSPQGASVFWTEDDTPFCTTPCPALRFSEGEEREIIVKKKGYHDERQKLTWKISSPMIVLSKKKIKTNTRTKTKTKPESIKTPKTKTETIVKPKNDGGSHDLKDPF